MPLRKFLPGFKGFDLAIIAAMLIFEVVEMLLLLWIKIQIFPGILGTLVIAIGMLGNKVINLYFYAVIINVVMSWVPSLQHSPVANIISMIVNPPLGLARRVIPSFRGIDLSPIPVLIVLKLITIFIFNPIILEGYRLAY